MSETTPTIPVAYCRTCGKALYEAPRRGESGAAYCEEHFPAAESAAGAAPGAPTGAAPPPNRFGDSAYSSSSAPHFNDPPRSAYAQPDAGPQPYRPTVVSTLGTSPPLAFLLGFIPGVGAIYNAQYAKGLVHAVTFGLLISIISSGLGRGLEPLVSILLAAFVFYMAFEAYHTARKRRDGEPVDEFSSLLGAGAGVSRFPAAGLALIGLGVLLLLMTNDLISDAVLRRAWPLALIAIGGYMLYARMRRGKVD
jgi:TM2 domain-containing membrane protein YozV